MPTIQDQAGQDRLTVVKISKSPTARRPLLAASPATPKEGHVRTTAAVAIIVRMAPYATLADV
ncbi:MAG TPA: hypothetical protein PKW68_01065 [bacterium]|nr:hypothetical protein [bacterium]